jgi:hypothetical protein
MCIVHKQAGYKNLVWSPLSCEKKAVNCTVYDELVIIYFIFLVYSTVSDHPGAGAIC